MALSLLFGKKYDQANIGGVELDVTLREVHSYNSRVTNYPIEEGSILSDHIINEPTIVVLEGIVTDTPLAILTFFNRSVDAFNRLVEIHQKRQIISVITGLKKYQRMVITSLDVPRDLRTGQSLSFNIELKEVILDTSIRLEQNQDNIFGGTQSKIPEEIVSSGDNIPFIQQDPQNTLKDQATSGTDIGIQSLQPVPADTVVRLNESLDFIQGVA